MRFLLDTNAVSEPQRQRPNDGYMAWIAAQASEDLAVSSLTFGELRRGVTALTAGHRKTALSAWLAAGAALFGDRILPIDLRGRRYLGRAVGAAETGRRHHWRRGRTACRHRTRSRAGPGDA